MNYEVNEKITYTIVSNDEEIKTGDKVYLFHYNLDELLCEILEIKEESILVFNKFVGELEVKFSEIENIEKE